MKKQSPKPSELAQNLIETIEEADKILANLSTLAQRIKKLGRQLKKEGNDNPHPPVDGKEVG